MHTRPDAGAASARAAGPLATSLRGRFPGLRDSWARLDGAAGSQALDSVIGAVADYLAGGVNANTEGLFAASVATDALIARTRGLLGTFLGADPAGFVFGANMTSLAAAFARSLARTLKPGDEIVCTRLDHDANVAPWLAVARDTGARVVFADFDPVSGRLPVGNVAALLNDRTRLVAFTGASNALGTIPDVAAISAAARAAGALALLDAVHLVPHSPVDIAAWGCDVVFTSAHKWYGPHLGILWARPELLAELDPYQVRPASDEVPHRWQTGTLPLESVAGVAAAAQFLLDAGMGELAERERAVFAPLLSGLTAMPHVTVYGPSGLADRTPTVAFTVAGRHPDEVARALADRRIAVWSGSFYAHEAMAVLGLDRAGGAVRAGVSCYTEPDDVERLLIAVSDLR
ncbi:cysteine desulfurase family protein, VC1184 subfamily [Sinosporangium album]|uniref:Cysteine desulfurase family protein, VC1184 subfamily n=1 Tax=Sinosporangium album TaxID=504805 RepID=A0A1G7QIR5_9ACTN|nr:cysteine desulfurase-like protein [Sinosporangium album]SDF98421.1 cysteine desulfurase family protein, VC1184 subfamily [Sinosporangium album]